MEKPKFRLEEIEGKEETARVVGVANTRQDSSCYDEKTFKSLEEIEREHISMVLKETSDFEEAAKILGIDTTTLWRKRKKYNL